MLEIRLPAELERLEAYCFRRTGILEVTLGAALKAMALNALDGCRNLRTVYVMKGCRADVQSFLPQGFTVIHSVPQAIGKKPLSAYRAVKDVVLPSGLSRVGSEWFLNSEIQSVTIPDSVREIMQMAFCGSAGLKKVIFQKDSALEKLGDDCFRESGLTSFSVPEHVKMIGERAFQGCAVLRTISFCEGCELKVIGVDAFRASGLTNFKAPEQLRVLA